MNKVQARSEALLRSYGVLQEYLNSGSLYEHYTGLPEEEVEKIEREMQAIANRLMDRAQQAYQSVQKTQ